MGIENFPGIKPGDIIDLSKFEKTKKEPSFETYLPEGLTKYFNVIAMYQDKKQDHQNSGDQ